MRMKNSDIERLKKFQNLFYSTLLQVQKSSVFFLHWELGALLMPMRILKEKVNLYFHISNLPEKAYAKRILKIQESYNWPSLRDEVRSFFNEFEIHDLKKFSKSQFKKLVSEKI